MQEKKSDIHLEFRQYKFALQVDAALVYAALRKSGLISNGCSGREIYLVGNRQTSGESASLPQYDEGTESAEVAAIMGCRKSGKETNI
jgi:hypothetical protein